MNNKTKSSVDGVTTPHLNEQSHGGKSTGLDAYRNFTLGHIEDEINEMERLDENMLPRQLYVQSKQALETLKSFFNFTL